MIDFEKDAVHLVRLALEGRLDDVAAISRRVLRAVVHRRPDLAPVVQGLFAAAAASVTRATSQPLPVDLENRLELLRRELVPELSVAPTWPKVVAAELDAVVSERKREDRLADAGVAPTRSLLFVGDPGVGKTLAARWLAVQTGRPLLTLDLAAVMSSFLGRTGNNIRVVLDYARKSPSVLLLDEFDAIAKRRDDATEVGELKRLVTVLLQAIDDWPTSGLLVAATNHPELLDPAVWRRFDRVVRFPSPSVMELETAIRRLLPNNEGSARIELLAALLEGSSFADVTRMVSGAKRTSIVADVMLADVLEKAIVELSKEANTAIKLRVAATLASSGKSRREISMLTGLSRDTIRKHLGHVSRARARNRKLMRREARS